MTIAGRLVCYAIVTAGSLAAGGISVGWLMNPDRVATTAAIEQPQSVEPPITERKPAVLYAVPEGRGPRSATAAAPTVTTREMPASLPLQPPLGRPAWRSGVLALLALRRGRPVCVQLSAA